MRQRARQLLELALELSPSERADLVEALLETLESASPSDVEASWVDECRRRLDRFDTDGATLSWDEVEAELEARSGRRRA